MLSSLTSTWYCQVFSLLYLFGHSNRYVVVSHYGFNLHSLMTNNTFLPFFMHFFSINMSSLVKSLPPSFIRLFVFLLPCYEKGLVLIVAKMKGCFFLFLESLKQEGICLSNNKFCTYHTTFLIKLLYFSYHNIHSS